MVKLMLLFSFICFPLLAQEDAIYCTPEQIEITESAILIHFEEDSFETDSLSSDENGLFVCATGLRPTHCKRPINIKHVCEYGN